MPGGERLARYAISASRGPRWVSELAEELAAMCAAGSDPGTLSKRIRAAAAEQGIPDYWFVAQLVAHEWDRLGIARVPAMIQAGGW
jgi:hypothetical protein